MTLVDYLKCLSPGLLCMNISRVEQLVVHRVKTGLKVNT